LGKPGNELDVPGSVDVVSMAYYQLPTRTLDLPMDPVAPTVTDETATTVFEEFAEPAVAAPVKVRITDPTDDDFKARTVMVEPTEIAPTLSFDVEDGTLEPAMNSEELIKAIGDDLDGLERSGRNARIVIRSGKPVVVRSLTGRTLDEEEVADGVFAVLPETTATARTVKVALSVKQPRFTTKDAKALKIKEKLSSFRQYFPPAQYRYVNVGRAAEYLNGTILEPGETFSMNETIKERTPANGYTEGYIISGGRFREDLGGGVSIITTATWTAGFYAGLERVEQHPHGLYISRYKAGLEATVAWGYLDLKMRNDTGNGVLITATRYSDGVLIEMWGTKKYDKVTATFSDRYNYTDFQKVVDNSDECVASEGVRGFSISVTRRRYIDGKVASKETWPTIYKPTPNVVCTSPRASG
jgi:vancomycin resistance protein YoaR